MDARSPVRSAEMNDTQGLELDPFQQARARTLVRAGFASMMVVAALGFFAFYQGGGGLLFSGAFELTIALVGYGCSLVFLFGFYGLLAEWGKAKPGAAFTLPRIRGGLVALALVLFLFVLLLPTFLPFVRRRATSVGFAALATAIMAPVVAVPIVLAADVAFARLVGL
jgi:hypothetical protein